MAIEKFETKQEQKLYYTLQNLINNCVDRIGLNKKPTIKQLLKAKQALTNYENQSKNK